MENQKMERAKRNSREDIIIRAIYARIRAVDYSDLITNHEKITMYDECGKEHNIAFVSENMRVIPEHDGRLNIAICVSIQLRPNIDENMKSKSIYDIYESIELPDTSYESIEVILGKKIIGLREKLNRELCERVMNYQMEQLLMWKAQMKKERGED